MGSTTVPSDYAFALSEVFVLLFVTLGPPIKVPAVFLSTTRHLQEDAAKGLASKAFLFAVAAALVGGFIGVSLMQKWHVSDAALRLAGGIVFFLVSLRSVMGEYEKGGSGTPPQGVDVRTPTAFEIAVPMLVTPYGLAAIILLIARSQDTTRLVSIAALVLVVMVLNLLAMRYARPVMHTIGPIPLQLFGTIVGVLTVGLSIQILIGALHQLGALASAG